MNRNSPDCPGCGREMKYRKGHGIYECTNSECNVIRVRAVFSDKHWIFKQIVKAAVV